MPERANELEGCSIVVAGSFNPAIFHPLWFVQNGLIRDEEGESAKLEMTHREAAVFSTGWFTLQVTLDRFVIDSPDPTKVQPLRDLVAGTFKVLEHTPITQCGLHRWSHTRMKSEEEWHCFGHFFTPKAVWEKVLSKPGMQSLSILGRREGMMTNPVTIRIEPSAKVLPGVYIHVHQHHGVESATPLKVVGAELVQKILAEDWNSFIEYCRKTTLKLFESFDENKG